MPMGEFHTCFSKTYYGFSRTHSAFFPIWSTYPYYVLWGARVVGGAARRPICPPKKATVVLLLSRAGKREE